MPSDSLQPRKTIYLIILVLALFIGALVLFLREPYIRSLSPRQALPGDTIIISGQYFGQLGPRKSLVVGAQRITRSHILSWQSQEIRFRMPDGMRSGYVSVKNNQSTSNLVFLTNIERIPQPRYNEETIRIEAEVIENAFNSLWRIEANVDLGLFDIFVQGQPVLDAERIQLPNNETAFYIPELRVLSADSNASAVSANLLLAQLELREKQVLAYNELFQIKPRNRVQVFNNSLGAELYSLSIEFIPEESNGHSEFIVLIPIAQIPNISMIIESTFRGWVQMLPFSHTHAQIRLLPYNRASGELNVQFFTDGNFANTQPQYFNETIAEQELGGYQDSILFPLYENFLITSESPLLSPAQLQSLESAITRDSPSPALVSEIYAWFSENAVANHSAAFADELRRRGIPARVRYALRSAREATPATGQNSHTISWVEIFIPQSGWLPTSSEHAGTIPLPVENPFPLVFDNAGNAVEGIMRYSVEFADPFESSNSF